jgi:hypothetical protein
LIEAINGRCEQHQFQALLGAFIAALLGSLTALAGLFAATGSHVATGLALLTAGEPFFAARGFRLGIAAGGPGSAAIQACGTAISGGVPRHHIGACEQAYREKGTQNQFRKHESSPVNSIMKSELERR